MKTLSSAGNPRNSQSGAALVVVLMILVIVTLLGIVSMRGAIMQERMATNSTTRAMAFQVAEAGLRQAEIIARDTTLTFPASGCSAGRCAMVAPPAVPAWSAADFWTNGAYQTGSAVNVGGGRSIRPRYVIEDFGQTSNGGGDSCVDLSTPCIESSVQRVYRITSYAAAPNGAEVVLQSLYRR